MKKGVVYLIIFLISISLAIAVDNDGDGCDTQPGPYASFDCNDNDPSICNYADKDLYFDMDKDGHYPTLPAARTNNDDWCTSYSFQFSPGNDGGYPPYPSAGCDWEPLYWGVNCENTVTATTPTTPQTPSCTVLKWGIDQDGDGYCGGVIDQCTSPGVGWKTISAYGCDWDCNDGSKNIGGKEKWYLDKDNDGYYPLGGVVAPSCTSPGNDWSTTVKKFWDCNDSDASVNPVALEIPNNDIDDDCKDGDYVIGDIDINDFNGLLDSHPELRTSSDWSQTNEERKREELQKFADKYGYDNVRSVLFDLNLLEKYPDLKDKMKHTKELTELGYSIGGAGFFIPTSGFFDMDGIVNKFKETIYPFGGGSDEFGVYGSYHITEYVYLKGSYIYKREQILGSDADWIEQVYAPPTTNTPISGGAIGITYEVDWDQELGKSFNYVKTEFKNIFHSIAGNN